MKRKQSESAEAVWRDRLARFGKSNLSVAEFCRQEGVSDPSFYQWRRRLQKERPETKAARQAAAAGSGPFVPMKVSTASAVAEIEFPNGVRIRVPATNAEALRAALQVGHELYREAT